MFDAKKAESMDQSVSRLPPEMVHVHHTALTALKRLKHPHRFVICVVLHAAPLLAQGLQQKDISPKARVRLSVGGPSHLEFLSPYYKAGRYVSQGGCALFYLQH